MTSSYGVENPYRATGLQNNLFKIKHWKIICTDYSEAPDVKATWFIDPPYKENSGKGYRHGSGNIDYKQLARWAKSRKGEIIFCEGLCGDYLPFTSLLELKGIAGKSSKEVCYYKSSKGQAQIQLFT